MFEQFRNDAVYNTRAVVQRTGVPADTVRAWERRYGIPVPRRSAGNQRLYSERDIATIAWLRDQTREGLTISQAVALLRSKDQEQSKNGVETRVGIETIEHARFVTSSFSEDPYKHVRDRFVNALLRFDGIVAERAIEDALAMLSVEQVCLGVMAEALVEIGDLWARGEATVASEHFASRFVQRKLATLFNASTPDDGYGPILSACVTGEHHEIGLLLTSLFLSRRGFHVTYLGADVPTDDLDNAVASIRPTVVLLSASTATAADTLEETASRLAGESSSSLRRQTFRIGFGGRIFELEPDRQSRIEGTYFGADAREAVSLIQDTMTAHSFASNTIARL